MPQLAQSRSVICHQSPISASFPSISSIDFFPMLRILEMSSFDIAVSSESFLIFMRAIQLLQRTENSRSLTSMFITSLIVLIVSPFGSFNKLNHLKILFFLPAKAKIKLNLKSGKLGDFKK